MKPSFIPAKAGISLKSPYYKKILENKPPVSWFEVHPENLRSGAILSSIEKIREDYPLSFHGVGLSLGSTYLSDHHLSFLKSLCDRLQPGLVSEHVAWSSVDGVYVNDLLPLPYTKEALNILVDNIQHTQEVLKREILIENPSAYVCFDHSTYTEEDFIVEVAQRGGCSVLLDVNNVYVSSYNHGRNPKAYIKKIAESSRIKEVHLAGHERIKIQEKDFLVDAHGGPVISPVWDLYEYALSLVGRVPTLVEWDNHLPSFEVLWAEGQKADLYMEKVCAPLEIAATI